MGYSQAPLRNLDTLNSTNFTLNDNTLTIRNSKRVLVDIPDRIGKTLNERLLPVINSTSLHLPYICFSTYQKKLKLKESSGKSVKKVNFSFVSES
jgi:hypothetical protein